MTGGLSRSPRPDLGRRLHLVLLLAALLLVGTAAPAAAHGAGGDDATNYRSTVGGVTAVDGPAPADPAVSWRVVAGDALLEVDNRSGDELVVEGYEGEPYLRIGPDGVFENRMSRATYLNADRYAAVQVPAGADPTAPPEWARVGDTGRWAWHDHRVHWMAATLPPAVKVDPTREVEVLTWTVPFTLGGDALQVAGDLRWVPPPPRWPWLVGGVLAMAAPAAILARGRRGWSRRRALQRGGGLALGVATVLLAVRTADDVFAVPATGAEQALLLARAAVFVAAGAIGAGWGLRGGRSAPLALAAGALLLLVGTGAGAWTTLGSSQLASALPDAVGRAAAATTLAAVVPAALGLWVLHDRPRAPAAQPTATEEPVPA